MRLSILGAAVVVALVAMGGPPAQASFHSKGPKISLGGMTCAVCTVITGMVDQLAVVHREDHKASFKRLCGIFPSPFSGFCSMFNLFYGSGITRALANGETPDAVCLSNKMCSRPAAGQPTCHLFPEKSLKNKNSAEVNEYLDRLIVESGFPAPPADGRAIDFCSTPLIGSLACSFLNVHAFNIEYPEDDPDKDGFSDEFTFRGSAWRGKDCADTNVATYPGRRPSGNDDSRDSNCNGISGRNAETRRSLEDELCGNTGAKGVIALGDSVTANFHIPGSWFNATIVTRDLYRNLSVLMENSFNWPHTSFYTGYQSVDWPIIEGGTDSLYLRMRERNLCNHRDYQNIGFNGATIPESTEYSQSVKRNAQDKPAIAIFSYIGNDVCGYNADPALDDTTTPEQARAGLLDTMAVLNSKLPAGSHALIVGVADARPFFASLMDKIHPFGAVREDVTYLNFYEWLECLDINPCKGWLTGDETIRAVTAQRVVNINNELQRVVQEYQHQFPNVEMVYIPNPVDDVLAAWLASGGESWQLVEAFDGFHPNQKAHQLVAEVLWNRLERDHPSVIGPINPNNDRIRELFGNQGGH
ncbi:Acyloxyacyl hydrolase [Hypsibius exemplaris]|uniref:Acyloxyacyl hydrolase n=1 Tax=Hypsibius exemplaris TaxID=2072580 RepID=A0A1W0WU07_HYPEX|nr:Acyloxyacyl hydrolase [Hypsibius exemplaris]